MESRDVAVLGFRTDRTQRTSAEAYSLSQVRWLIEGSLQPPVSVARPVRQKR
jgi:hypothetical protein